MCNIFFFKCNLCVFILKKRFLEFLQLLCNHKMFKVTTALVKKKKDSSD